VNNDGGYSRARALVAAAQAFGVRIGHGNGGGPHNVPFFAALSGTMPVEYHYHRWQAYNAIFERVPQPDRGVAVCSDEPGTGLTPNLEIVTAFGGPAKINMNEK
jgi:L-alanine-DL-glutamate epimerase-like enolase superfamily enzyme